MSYEEYLIGRYYYEAYAAAPELLLSDIKQAEGFPDGTPDEAMRIRLAHAMAYSENVHGNLLEGLMPVEMAERELRNAQATGDPVLILATAALFSLQLGAFESDTNDGPCSFSADTPVMTDDGLVPIADIDIGELVLAYDEATGTTGFYTVTATLAHVDPVIVYLTIDGETIATTPEHPFYSAGNWIEAGALRAGMWVRQPDNTAGLVLSAYTEVLPQTMYNFSVDTAHTYFVGNKSWLVHNTCGIGRGGKQARLRELGRDDKTPSAIRGWIRQEQNAIANGRRSSIRVPNGYLRAHRRGFEARRGYGYEYADLQNTDIHKLQHRWEGYRPR